MPPGPVGSTPEVSGRLVGSPVFNTGVGLHSDPRGSIPCTSAVDPNAKPSGVLGAGRRADRRLRGAVHFLSHRRQAGGRATASAGAPRGRPPDEHRPNASSQSSSASPRPSAGSTVCDRVHWRDLVVGPGFEVLVVFTIWVKARAGLSDILHQAVGEMPGRVETPLVRKCQAAIASMRGCRCAHAMSSS